MRRQTKAERRSAIDAWLATRLEGQQSRYLTDWDLGHEEPDDEEPELVYVGDDGLRAILAMPWDRATFEHGDGLEPAHLSLYRDANDGTILPGLDAPVRTSHFLCVDLIWD